MNTSTLLPLVCAAVAALAGCSSTRGAPGGAAALPSPKGVEDCLFIRNVDDWSPIDRERLIIYGIGRVPYLATLVFPSTDLQWDFAVAFEDRNGDGRLCSFDAVRFRDAIPDRIQIARLERIAQADAEVLLKAANPKRKARKVAPSEAPAAESGSR